MYYIVIFSSYVKTDHLTDFSDWYIIFEDIYLLIILLFFENVELICLVTNCPIKCVTDGNFRYF